MRVAPIFSLVSVAAAAAEYCDQGSCDCGECLVDGSCKKNPFKGVVTGDTGGTCMLGFCYGRGANVECSPEKKCMCEDGYFADWGLRSHCKPKEIESCWVPGGSCYAAGYDSLCGAVCATFDWEASAAADNYKGSLCEGCLKKVGLDGAGSSCISCLSTCSPASNSEEASDAGMQWLGVSAAAVVAAAVMAKVAVSRRPSMEGVDQRPLMA
mmetsp:Transcript_24989/g.60585  ORF Transcript_24989/g.60585 Transcript_24989/m.60585 type:complete len:211 (+) Transcript_24989:52-684(+)